MGPARSKEVKAEYRRSSSSSASRARNPSAVTTPVTSVKLTKRKCGLQLQIDAAVRQHELTQRARHTGALVRCQTSAAQALEHVNAELGGLARVRHHLQEKDTTRTSRSCSRSINTSNFEAVEEVVRRALNAWISRSVSSMIIYAVAPRARGPESRGRVR